MEALDRAQELLATWREEVRRELPSDVEIFDAHTHLGDDIERMRGRPDELLGMMDEYGVGRAFMFCLDEPDRHPGFRAPNDRTLTYASESNGRLIPFVRLDLKSTRSRRPSGALPQGRAASSCIRGLRRSRSKTSG